MVADKNPVNGEFAKLRETNPMDASKQENQSKTNKKRKRLKLSGHLFTKFP